LSELEAAKAMRAREEHRGSVEGLAETYVQMTGDRTAAALIRDYVQRREPRLDREAIDAMRAALEIAAAASGDYAGLPEAVLTRCVEMCIALDEQGDSRLLGILDAAEGRRAAAGVQETIYEHYPGLTRDVEDAEIDRDIDLDNERGPRRGR
jgi:hypothetical protein